MNWTLALGGLLLNLCCVCLLFICILAYYNFLILRLCKIVVSELLFSAGVGCCFTQPGTPRFHHVPRLATGDRIIIGAKAAYLNSKNQNPLSCLRICYF